MQQPKVTLAVFTYNQRDFVRETLAGVFAQDYPNLDVVISDDHSTDGTFELLEELTRAYGGPHRVLLNRNPENIGLVRHVNKVLSEFVDGDYVLMHGGDDVCLPDTVSCAMTNLLDMGVDSISFKTYRIDGSSRRHGADPHGDLPPNEVYGIPDYLAGRHRTSGAVRLFKYDIFRTFGPFREDCPTEDSTNLLRTFLYGKVGYSHRPNLYYRIHANNISGTNSLMTRFDPAKIAAQYRADLSLALRKGMISHGEHARLVCHVERYERKGLAERDVFHQSGTWARILRAGTYFFREGYGLADTVRLLRRIRKWNRG